MAPAAVQQQELARLFPMLLLVALLVVAVGMLAIGSQSLVLAHRRAPEVAIRRATGAARWHLLGAAVLETLASGGMALAIGTTAGALAGGIVISGWPGTVARGSMLPGTVAAALLGAAIGFGGLLPLWHARFRRVREVIPSSEPLLGATLQLGLCLTVLSAGALVARHAGHLLEPPVSHQGVGRVFTISGATQGDSIQAMRYEALLDRLHQHAGLTAVSLTSPGVLVGLGTVHLVTADCGMCPPSRYRPVRVTTHLVSADTFAALGLRIVTGRWFDGRDDYGGPPVVVINQTLAAAKFRSPAIGRDLYLGLGLESPHTVIGVVADQPGTAFGAAELPPYTVYLSVTQHPTSETELLVRAPGDPQALATVPAIVGASLGLPVSTVRSAGESALYAAEAAPLAWLGWWFIVEGWAMLLLGFVGSFAAMRRWVASLYPELGLRKAVGARRRDLALLIASGVARVGVRGTVVGIVGGYVLCGALGDALPNLPSWDPGIVARYALVLTLAAGIGALAAGWKAVRARPAELIGAE
jgi:hypothetical protein